MTDESLYFIAIVPPGVISGQITGFKQAVREKYGSGHALRSPPHITLHMPFGWRDKKYHKLQSTLEAVSAPMRPFEIELDGFGGFEPRVVYVQVTGTPELEACQGQVRWAMRSLQVLNADYKQKAFQPHITIAFRDLKKAQYYQVMEEYAQRKYAARFVAGSLVLLRHHHVQGQPPEWRIHQRFVFGG